MKIIAVDDEKIALEGLMDAIKAAIPEAELYGFRGEQEALEFAKENNCGIAFLDIEMREMGGIGLAKALKSMNPDMNVIFTTGYGEYACDAFELHASGYIMKPVTKEKVEKELADLRYPAKTGENKLLRIQCLGNFDVFDAGGIPVHFPRSKAKELFAYLVHRQGTSCTIKEIAAVLFEDAPYDLKQQSYLQKIISAMMSALKTVGAGDVVIKSYNNLALNIGLVECDYYKLLQDKEEMENVWRGEYMSQYEWAEFVAEYLNRDFK